MKLSYYRGLTMDTRKGKVFHPHEVLKIGKKYLIQTHSAWIPRGDGGHFPKTWVDVYDSETSKLVALKEPTAAFTVEKEECASHELAALDEKSNVRQCQNCFSKFRRTVTLKPIIEYDHG